MNRSDGTCDMIERYQQFIAIKKALERTSSACQSLPHNSLIALSNLYHTYVRLLITSLLDIRAELSDCSVNPGVVTEQGSVSVSGDAPEHGLERELEGLSSKSHDEMVVWLEAKFGVPLKHDLAISPAFVEVIERMRLHVECGGKISNRYLRVCGENKVVVDELVLGEHLEVALEYFLMATDLIYETGVELGIILWRKVIPEQAAKATGTMQELALSLIEDRRYSLAGSLLRFANTALQDCLDEPNRLVFIVNSALAAYLADEKDLCLRILSAVDWTVGAEVLKLAYLVLSEQFDNAIVLMQKIGPRGRPSKDEYLRWPLFENFRKTKQFSSTFEALFGEITLSEVQVG
jgi:hypothetical protein